MDTKSKEKDLSLSITFLQKQVYHNEAEIWLLKLQSQLKEYKGICIHLLGIFVVNFCCFAILETQLNDSVDDYVDFMKRNLHRETLFSLACKTLQFRCLAETIHDSTTVDIFELLLHVYRSKNRLSNETLVDLFELATCLAKKPALVNYSYSSVYPCICSIARDNYLPIFAQLVNFVIELVREEQFAMLLIFEPEKERSCLDILVEKLRVDPPSHFELLLRLLNGLETHATSSALQDSMYKQLPAVLTSLRDLLMTPLMQEDVEFVFSLQLVSAVLLLRSLLKSATNEQLQDFFGSITFLSSDGFGMVDSYSLLVWVLRQLVQSPCVLARDANMVAYMVNDIATTIQNTST